MNKKLMKVITLILTCLLLVGAAVGITVAAEDAEAATPSVEIAKKNVSYDSKAQILYAVNAENVPEGAKVQMLFGTAAQTAVVGEVAVGAKDANGTYNGMPVFFSAGIAAKDYRMDLYAAPVIVDADGKIIAKGEAVNFTPYDYAMARFDGNYSAEQLNLYKAFLEYGAAVQAALGYTEADIETLGGWIDAYYNVTIGDTTVSLRPSEIPEDGNIALDKSVARFDEDGNAFAGWVDKNGNAVVGWVDGFAANPGEVFPVYAPVREGTLTFDGTDLPANATFKKASGADSYATVSNGSVAFGKNSVKVDGSSLKFAPTNPGSYATRYVFEGDFNWVGSNMTKNEWVYKLCLWSAGGEMTNFALTNKGDHYTVFDLKLDYNTWHHFKIEVFVNADGTVNTSLNVDGSRHTPGAQAAISGLKDYRMINAGVQMRDSSYHDATEAKLLLDNVSVYTVGEAASFDVNFDANGGEAVDPAKVTMGEAYTLPTPVGETPFLGWYYGDTLIPQTGTWTYFSNTKPVSLVAKWAVPVKVNLVLSDTATESVTLAYGKPYKFTAPTLGNLIFNYYTDKDGNKIPLEGDAWPFETETTLTANWLVEIAGTFNDFNGADGTEKNVGSLGSIVDGKFVYKSTSWNTNGYFKMGPNAPYTANSEGTKYIFEAKFTYQGGAVLTTSDYPAFIGFNNQGFNLSNVGMYYYDYMNTTSEDSGDGDAAYVTMFGIKFMKGQEYSIRFEYVVGDYTKMHVYVDGVYQGAKSLSAKDKVTDSDPIIADPTQVYGFQFGFRRKGNFALDDVYCGIQAPAGESAVTLDASGATLPDGTATTFSVMTGAPYTLPTPSITGLEFVGWYYGDIRVSQSGNWSINAENVTLTAKWYKNESAFVNKNNSSETDVKFNNYSETTAEASGTIYVFESDFYYGGISAFAIDENGVVTNYKTPNGGTGEFAYMGFYTSGNTGKRNLYDSLTIPSSAKWVDKDGNVVVDENGTLKDEYLTKFKNGEFTATDIYYSQARFGGIIFEIGKTYHLVIAMTLGDVTVTGGVASASASSCVVTATNDGVTQTGKFTATGTGLKYNCNGFDWYWRGASSIQITSYTHKCSITNPSLTAKKITADVDVQTYKFNDVDKQFTSAWSQAGLMLSDEDYDADNVYAPGTQIIVNTTFTYVGGSPTSGSGTAEDPYKNVKSGSSDTSAAFLGFHSGNKTNSDDRYGMAGLMYDGTVVEGEDGKLYWTKLKWGGITFERGKEYKLQIIYTVGNVTYRVDNSPLVTGASTVVNVLDDAGNVISSTKLTEISMTKLTKPDNFGAFGIYTRYPECLGGLALKMTNNSVVIIELGA